MKKAMILVGLLLAASAQALVVDMDRLDPVYVGIFGNEDPVYVMYACEDLSCRIQLDLQEGEVAYYFYNAGFGMVSWDGEERHN